jgi:AmiR/NasT family two-component response regulator
VARDDATTELAQTRRDLAAATDHAQHLEIALASSRQIGTAMGILMERHRLTEEQAFDQLRGMSSRRNVKLRDIATEIVCSGDVDPGDRQVGAAPSAVLSTDRA